MMSDEKSNIEPKCAKCGTEVGSHRLVYGNQYFHPQCWEGPLAAASLQPPEDVAGLVERGRSLADCDARSGEPLGKCMRQMADALVRLAAERDRLRAEVERLREALRPFAKISKELSQAHLGYYEDDDKVYVPVGAVHDARAALGEKADG